MKNAAASIKIRQYKTSRYIVILFKKSSISLIILFSEVFKSVRHHSRSVFVYHIALEPWQIFNKIN